MYERGLGEQWTRDTRDSDLRRDFAEESGLGLRFVINFHATFIMDQVYGWIEQLCRCRFLIEADVEKLCDKV